MIELTWGQLRDNDLNPALNKLATAHLELNTTIKILGILKAIKKEWLKSEDVRLELMAKVGQLTPDKKGYVPVPGKEKEWDEMLNGFHASKSKIRYPKIKLEALKSVSFTVVDLDKLEPLIDGIEYPEEKPSASDKSTKK